MSRNGVVKGFSEPRPVGIAATVGVLQCIGEDTPERVHVVAGAQAGIREEPGIQVIQRGDPLEGVGNRLLHAQELRQPARYPPSVFVGDPPVEEAEGGERADVLHGTRSAVREVVLQGDGPGEGVGNLLDGCYQRSAVVPVCEEPVGEFRVEVRPGKTGIGFRLVAKPVLPVVFVAKGIDVLFFALKDKADESVGSPSPRKNSPDRAPICVEEPFPGRVYGSPSHLEVAAVADVSGDRSRGLDSHHGDRMSPIVEGQVLPLDVGCFDGDAVPGQDGLHILNIAVKVAVLPSSLPEEAGGLVGSASE